MPGGGADPKLGASLISSKMTAPARNAAKCAAPKGILRLWLQLGGNAASLQWAGRAELDNRRHPQSYWRGRRRAGRGEGYRRGDTQNRGDYLVIAEFSSGSQARYRTASTRFDQPMGQQRARQARRAPEHRRRQKSNTCSNLPNTRRRVPTTTAPASRRKTQACRYTRR